MALPSSRATCKTSNASLAWCSKIGQHSARRGGCDYTREALGQLMSADEPRDMIGYGATPPDPQWPNGARLAVNFVLNYEEGSEASFADGDGYSETGLTESSGQGVQGRDLAAESMYEYGSRVGFWRILRLF